MIGGRNRTSDRPDTATESFACTMRSSPAIELFPGRPVGPEHPVLVVAEMGQNHNGSVALACQMIEAAAAAGADAVKFCKRDLEHDLAAPLRRRPYRSPHSFGATYGEHRARLELSIEEHRLLQQVALGWEVPYFATACDPPSVQQLEELGVPCYKVASRDLTNDPLLHELARTGKPLVLSTGMDGPQQIARAVELVLGYHDQVVLLHCTSAYPTPFAEADLRVLGWMQQEFRLPVGLSDHTLGSCVAVAAVALGAVMVEKHFTLDRRLRGRDHACSLEPQAFARMVEEIRRVELALGQGEKRVPPSVESGRWRLQRSVVARCPIPAGTRVQEHMLCVKTAGQGVPWSERHRLLGRTARRNIGPDEPILTQDVL